MPIPKATPPLGSINNHPVQMPPSFDEVYEEIRQRHNREEGRAALGLLLAIALVSLAIFCSNYAQEIMDIITRRMM